MAPVAAAQLRRGSRVPTQIAFRLRSLHTWCARPRRSAGRELCFTDRQHPRRCPARGESPLSNDDLPPAPELRRTKKKKAAEQRAQPARPIWYRYLLWVVMACFTVGAVFELRAQYYYKHNLRIAQEALERTEGGPQKVTYDEIKDRFWGTPESGAARSDFVDNSTYTWSWRGIRKYVVRLYVSPKDGQLRKVESQP